MLTMILLVFSFVCLLLAACNVAPPRVNLGWLGMAFYVASILVGRV